MKSILLSIMPKWVAKILNGEKTIEVRKKFPKDYKGWVYIYCTKGNDILTDNGEGKYYLPTKDVAKNIKKNKMELNGKIVACFYCDKLEEIYISESGYYFTDNLNESQLLEKSCLYMSDLSEYFEDNIHKSKEVLGYAIHISQLEIFDRPKELREFDKHNFKGIRWDLGVGEEWDKYRGVLTKAPQSFCYVEVDE